MTTEEKIARAKEFRLIDDVFFEVFAEDEEACQEILQVILEDGQLAVLDVVVQSSKRNIYGRSVRLDALCTLGDGKKCNIEVQRANDDGLHELYVNTKVKDGSKISDLMDCFMQREVFDNVNFPTTSRRVRELKTTEGGAGAVCDIVQKLVDEGREEGRTEGIVEGISKLIRKGYSKEDILDLDYTEEEYAKAEAVVYSPA